MLSTMDYLMSVFASSLATVEMKTRFHHEHLHSVVAAKLNVQNLRRDTALDVASYTDRNIIP